MPNPVHYIRTCVLNEIVLGELNKLLANVRNNEDEQKKLKATATEITALIDSAEQKSSDVTAFLGVVHKYEHIQKLTPEIMHKLIEKIVVHEADKSSGKRVQQIDIYYRFDVAVSSVTAETGKYGKKDCLTEVLRSLH